jgi:hypothetical protein
MTHRNRARLSKLSLALVAALAAAPVFAQSTSAGVVGHVSGADGQPVAGAEVTITHVESGTVSRAVTDANGNYASRGLRVGGPYTITVNKAGAGVSTQENVYLQLNQVADIETALNADVATLGSVQVVGSGVSDTFSSENKGVGTSISGRQLEIAPQGNRSLDDIARLDPRISVTDPGTGRISMAGVNNRYNNISVDGLGQNDPFGLNSNGMPYTGSPISVDTIAAYDIKASDFDVSQDSIGANINAVTKSGTNEFHGSVYYAFKNAKDMVGNDPEDGSGYDAFDKDVTKGATFGGPILKNKLFFFGSYEEQEVSGLAGAGEDGYTTGKISREDIDRVIDIAKNTYGIADPGSYGGDLGVALNIKRYLGKLDWNISDNHRASLTYQQTKETLPSPYDQNTNTVILSTRWYTKASETKNVALQLFSDWSDNFSTEVKISQQKFDQDAGNAINLPSFQVATNGLLPTGSPPNNDSYGIRFGEDRNRHENEIHTKKTTASIFGTYYLGDHTLKFGFDWMKNDAINLYGRDLHGVYTFASIDDFEAGRYSYYTVRRPYDGFTEADTAASVTLSQFSPFAQDTWQVNDNLSVMYGVRVNIPKGESTPPLNEKFEDTFGFPNNYTLGASNKVVLPRASFSYSFDTERYSQLRGGIGLFQSVPPYVWLANPFQNNGMNAGSFTRYAYDPAYPVSVDPYDQPYATPFEPGSGSVQVDSIDPDFKMPTMWKATLGYDAELPWGGLVGTAEIQYLRAKDALFYNALNIGVAQGQLADGRDSYWCAATGGAETLSQKNCGAQPGFNSGSNGTTVLRNSDKGGSTAVTLSLNKPMSNGWYGNLSYTYTHATEVGSDTSSQAWSSYQYVSRLNPNENIARTATQEIRNSIKLSLGWEHAFFGDYKTSITAFYNGHDGLPYTWIYNGADANGDGISQDPAYIPTFNDARVSYTTSQIVAGSPVYSAATADQIQAFQEFIESNDYLKFNRGRIAERNANHLPWVNQLDLGLQQELPGLFKGHKSIVRLDIYNFLNLLDKDWGQTASIGGFDTRNFAGLKSVNADGTYTYNLYANGKPTWQNLSVYDAASTFQHRLVSRWSALLTVRYEF